MSSPCAASDFKPARTVPSDNRQILEMDSTAAKQIPRRATWQTIRNSEAVNPASSSLEWMKTGESSFTVAFPPGPPGDGFGRVPTRAGDHFKDAAGLAASESAGFDLHACASALCFRGA